jgi:hypothetical protein
LKDVLRVKGEFLVPANGVVKIFLAIGYEKKVRFEEFKRFVVSSQAGKKS